MLGIRVFGKGMYIGSTIITQFRIVSRNIKDAKIVTKDKVYTGGEIQLDENSGEIRVIYQGVALEYGVDYTVERYENNVNTGKATIVIKGIGNFGGTNAVSFNISSRNFLWWVR